jgi:uncharacterized protein
MFFLDLEEKRELAKATVAAAAGRIPVICSGHTSDSSEEQAAELRAMAGYEELRHAGVEVNTLTVIQHHNGDYPEEVYDFLCSIDAEYMQFIPVVEHADRRGLEGSVSPAQFGEFLCRVFDRWAARDIGIRYVQHVDMLLGIYMGQGSGS